MIMDFYLQVCVFTLIIHIIIYSYIAQTIGVFDGHGGMAASTSVSQLLPNLIADETSAITSAISKTTTQDFKNILESC